MFNFYDCDETRCLVYPKNGTYPTQMIKLELTKDYIRYPEEGFLTSMSIMDAAEEIEKILNAQNNLTIGLDPTTTWIDPKIINEKWYYRIIMDGPRKYHIDIRKIQIGIDLAK